MGCCRCSIGTIQMTKHSKWWASLSFPPHKKKIFFCTISYTTTLTRIIYLWSGCCLWHGRSASAYSFPCTVFLSEPLSTYLEVEKSAQATKWWNDAWNQCNTQWGSSSSAERFTSTGGWHYYYTRALIKTIYNRFHSSSVHIICSWQCSILDG